MNPALQTLARHRQTTVVVVLVVATLLSWGLSVEHALDGSTGTKIATVAILGIAFVKVSFVGFDFMEIRGAPAVLRLLFQIWLVVVFLTIALSYLIA
ncbi:cytochrome C oxidase subunit IV family protein [Sporichthya polymorpha]|uniref:cytochrome C oxidase subunit IV family protein n=1 Tax=Sporichthya polymorpha TaxID=35751 RepID=UPI000362D547|nr:cytochrome C oxidase subunit IV family protein [Sporichthya polymorpha]